MRGPLDVLPHRLRRWVFLAAWVSVLSGCASTFPEFKPDRCHRTDQARQILNWDIICLQTP